MKNIIRKFLQKTCSPADLGCWFDPLHLEFDAADAQISVLFPHAFFGSWFEQQGKDIFERCTREIFRAQGTQEIRFRYRTPSPPLPRPLSIAGRRLAAERMPSKAPTLVPELLMTSAVPDTVPEDMAQTFDNFITNDKNAFPLATARQVAEAASPPKYNPFIICGKSGTGKTHLLRALSSSLSHSHDDVFTANAETFAETLTRRGALAFAESYQALLVDDLQRVAHNTALQEKIIRLMDACQDNQQQMVFACSAAPVSLEGLTEGLRSRLEVGLVVELKEPDIDVRMRFAQMRCRRHHLKLEREHLLLLARRCAQLRYLSGVILKIAAFQSLAQRDLTAEDLENILRSSGEEKEIGAEEIIGIVAAHLQIPAEDIKGSRRQPHCVQARQWAMYLCRDLLGISYPALGRLFGGKDHSTVIHSIKKIAETIKSNKDAQLLFGELKRKCLSR